MSRRHEAIPVPRAEIAPTAPLRFDAKLFHAASLFMAVNDIRYYLNGLCWMPHPTGGAMLIATDGHQAAVAFDPEGRADLHRITPVSRSLVAAVRTQASVVALVDDRLTVFGADGIEKFIQPKASEIKGKFPDVLILLPDPEALRNTVTGFMAPHLIARICGAATALNTRYDSITHWQVPTPDSNDMPRALITRFSSTPNFVVLTMPMRGESDRTTPSIPGFITQAKHARREVIA